MNKGFPMNSGFAKYALIAIKVLVALAFLAAGLSKLAGVQMMVGVFDQIGVGQWLRYATGLIEVGGAIVLFVPGKQAIGAAVLVVTMIGAVLSHILILGPSMVPALTLGVLAAIILTSHRNQLARR